MGSADKKMFEKRFYDYSLGVVRFVSKLPNDTASRELGKQLVRSGTSVAANVTEARAASSRKDYINFYTHALKSANESTFWLALLCDSNPSIKDADKLKQESREIANILGASVRTMKKSQT